MTFTCRLALPRPWGSAGAQAQALASQARALSALAGLAPPQLNGTLDDPG